jgi:hypothetical protein
MTFHPRFRMAVAGYHTRKMMSGQGLGCVKTATTLERNRRSYSSKAVLVLELASAFNLEDELRNVILAVFRFFAFSHSQGQWRRSCRCLIRSGLLPPADRRANADFRRYAPTAVARFNRSPHLGPQVRVWDSHAKLFGVTAKLKPLAALSARQALTTPRSRRSLNVRPSCLWCRYLRVLIGRLLADDFVLLFTVGGIA